MKTSIVELLDDTSINKIAAGEVIDRPSSVVKELVENSLDAEARRIEVEIEAGGIGKIRVSDDGAGMTEADVRMAVLRHATSKIRSAEDLVNVASLGFRGEALPSIASVSKFQLMSRQPDVNFGTRLMIEGGQMTDVQECGAEIGTVVVVTDLFFNTPARLKFMKTVAAESSHIHDAMVRLAISRPDVTFRLTNNDRTTLHTPGTGQLSDTLSALYGPDTMRQLFPVDYTDGEIHIHGYAARPSIRKGSRQWQSFTVNHRVIGSRMLNRAVDTAYQTLLPAGSYPLVALQIQIPSHQVDVNVHPQKAEVKFQDERVIFRAVHTALKEVLSAPENPAAAAASFDHAAYRPQYLPSFVQEASPIQEAFASTKASESFLHSYSPSPSSAPVQQLLTETLPAAVSNQNEQTATDVRTEPKLKALAQYARCYILASDGESLYIIDQHAAHERLLFDLLSRKQVASSYQTLLIPKVLDLDPVEAQAAEVYANELAGLGFVFDWIGPGAVRISELPTHIPSEEAEDLFHQLLSSALNLKTPDMETFRQLWIETAACHMAVRAGQSLNQPQMQGLLDDLMKAERPYSCPHGRPTLIRFTDNDLAKLFKRI
ncbi:MAG: DNA mismatch repair endonuclease MutL [Negativicutes bacterium]